MKFFKKYRDLSTKRAPNIVFMALAVLCATAMWYAVSKRDLIEAQVEVMLDYTGTPPGLIVTHGLVNTMNVRLRAPETLLRALPRESLRTSIDLSNIKIGENSIPLGNGQVPEFRAFDIIDIQPPRIDITADREIERSVRVNASVESPLGSDALTIENVTVNPGTVILRGPESVISKKTEIGVKLQVDPKSVGLPQNKMITLDTPSLVSASPSAVDVKYTITSGRTVLTRQCPIIIAGDTLHSYETTPSELTVRVEVPEALAKDANYLKQLEARVVPPDMNPGQTLRLRPSFNLPEGMSFATPPDREITVTRAGS